MPADLFNKFPSFEKIERRFLVKAVPSMSTSNVIPAAKCVGNSSEYRHKQTKKRRKIPVKPE